MEPCYNELNQPIGFPVPDWSPPPVPPRQPMQGRYCRLEPLDLARHVASLWEAFSLDKDGHDWTYVPIGPFDTENAFRAWIDTACLGDDPLFFAIIEMSSGKPLGMACYVRITPRHGSIEVGAVHYSEPLKKTRAATEAMYLMMKNIFELGYRRYEWRCDALNAPARAAAQRLGFSYEGTFRQSLVHKGRNFDTAWYSVINSEWPALREAIETWLAPSNFNEQGRQQRLLSDMTAPLLHRIG